MSTTDAIRAERGRLFSVWTCLVCGAPSQLEHACEDHLTPDTWGDRFTYTRSVAEQNEAIVNVATYGRVGMDQAASIVGSKIAHYDGDFEFLLNQIQYVKDAGGLVYRCADEKQSCLEVAGNGIGSDEPNHWVKASMLHAVLHLDCGVCRLKYAQLSLTVMEDKRQGLPPGTQWDESVAASRERERRQRIADVDDLNLDDIVRKRMGDNR